LRLLGNEGFSVPGDREWNTFFSIFRIPSGKIVVFIRRHMIDAGGRVQVYDSFDAMRGAVPDKIIADAEANTRPPEQYPEEPLDV
jgi:hypothetical protein